MRFLLLGNDTGNGKTLSSVYLAKYYYDLGYKIYSNIQLKGDLGDNYIFIDGTNFIDELENSQDKKLVLLDEIGLATYTQTKTSIGMSNIVSQSRKSIGEKSHLIANTQMDIQLNPIWRGLIDYIIYPQLYQLKDNSYICFWYIEKKIKGFINFNNYIKNTYFKQIGTIAIKNISVAMNLYNTFMETDKFKDDRTYNKMKKKYKKMSGKRDMISNFKAILIEKEGLNPTEADRIGRAIIYEDLIEKEIS